MLFFANKFPFYLRMSEKSCTFADPNLNLGFKI